MTPLLHSSLAAGKLRLGALECLDILGAQRLAADPPVTALHLVDHHPGHAAHALALDLDHRFREAGDHLLLLLGGKHAFHHLDIDQWHRIAPFPETYDIASVWR